mmetsp:Transcript_5209/g.19570  ORF Transcript_5209/g.19570 Transcript_5209/m.19570 type:complete len:93 (+) Transcript_5209:211-489(+)
MRHMAKADMMKAPPIPTAALWSGGTSWGTIEGLPSLVTYRRLRGGGDGPSSLASPAFDTMHLRLRRVRERAGVPSAGNDVLVAVSILREPQI